MAFDFKKLSVLIVEDTAPMRKLIASVLETMDVGMIYTAENGERGYELTKKFNPDIIIADWHMEPDQHIIPQPHGPGHPGHRLQRPVPRC